MYNICAGDFSDRKVWIDFLYQHTSGISSDLCTEPKTNMNKPIREGL